MTNDRSNLPDVVGHEPTTIGAGGILLGLAAVVAGLIVAMLAIAGLTAYFAIADVKEPTVGPADPRDTAIAPPPGVPSLDPHQAGDLRRLRARERDLLTEYAWVDRDAGVARIPIRRAMEILAQEPPPSLQLSDDHGEDE